MLGFLIAIFVIAVLVLLAIWGLGVSADRTAKKSKINRQENAPIMKQYQDEYQQIIQKFFAEKRKVVGDCKFHVSLPEVSKTTYAAVTEDGNLVFYEENYSKRPEFDVYGKPHPGAQGSCKVLKKITISNILFWAEKGALQYTTASTGNGTQVVTNALKGAVIAGTAGAVVGGLGTLGAQSQTVSHDSRKIVVKMKNASEQEFPFSYKKGFMECIPKKEYEFLKMSNGLN